jgi:hypothetical protein
MIDVARDFERMRDYAVGRLSDDERRTFEERLVRDPDLVRELEQSLRMREGLEQLREQGYFGGTFARATRGWRMWVPALAAAAIAGLTLILWVQPRTFSPGVLRASPGSGAGLSQPVSAQFTFMSMRSSSAPELDLPDRGLIELRAAPAARAMASRFRLTLAHGEGVASQSVGTLSGLAVGADGYVHCYADASGLAPGSYSMRIEPDGGAGGAAETFAFRLRARGAAASR